jgi:hypothetical protein
LFAKVSREHRPPPLTTEERRRLADIPDFDDPDFEAKLGTATATIAQNKRALVRVWNALSDEDRRVFLVRIASPAELRRALA